MKKWFLTVLILSLSVVLGFSASARDRRKAVLKKVNWVGMDADKVGDWDNGKPDGKMDGHFKLQLAVPQKQKLKSIAVYSSNAAGNPEGGQVWHSENKTYWVLGVFSKDKQLNASHVPTLGDFVGKQVFDLYCNDSGWFKEGQHFLVEVNWDDGTKLTEVIRLSGGENKIQSITWIGKYADKVGDWGNGKPDGKLDGHFQLALNLSSSQEITSIAVYSSNEAGTPQGGQVWHSKNNSYWMLGVFSNGKQLNASHVATLGSFSGKQVFDLYCNDSGWFKEGQHFLVEITFAAGAVLKQTTKVAPAGGVSIKSFKWLDKEADKIGDWGNGKPDGKKDGHFQLQLDLSGNKEISSIAVYSADAAGNPQGGQVWHSQSTSYWMLGVFSGGKQLNPSHVQLLGKFSGTKVFDLYCNDSGWFKSGQNFMVEVILIDGSSAKKTVALP